MKEDMRIHPPPAKAVFVFSGFGSQWKTMGSGLLNSSPFFRDSIRHCSSVFEKISGWSIEEELSRESEDSQIEDSHVAPFCIFAVQCALVELLRKRGIIPAALLGHSMGEITAAYCAGVLNMEDALKVIQSVNRQIDRVRGRGCMAHVSLPAQDVLTLVQELAVPLYIAAVNSPTSTIVGGEEAGLNRLTECLGERNIFFRLLKNDAPMHTPLMESDDTDSASVPPVIGIPHIPVYSTLYGRKAGHGDFTPDYWNIQARKPVLFTRAIDAAIEEGFSAFLEIAPHPVLSGIMEECFRSHPGREFLSLGTMKRGEDEAAEFLTLLLTLREKHFAVNLDDLSELEKETLSRLEQKEMMHRAMDGGVAKPKRPVPGKEKLRTLIREALSEISRHKVAVTENDDRGFFEMGLDSLMSIRMKDYLSASLNLALPATVAFDYPTISSLACYLESELSGFPASHKESTGSDGRPLLNEPIAIIGMACRFPGGAKNPDKFWEVLRDGKNAVIEIPGERWDKELYYDPDASVPGKMYTKSGGFLEEGVYEFDAGFFGISPKEAVAMDPQHRMLQEVCWEAVENAGIDANSLKESRTGVYIGISCDDYEAAHRHSGNLDIIDAYSITGSTFSIAAGRISYFLGLQGPAFVVDTACSSSLVALHCACQSLRTGESDLSLISGVNLILTPEIYICFTKLRALSPGGPCRTFDASANGYCRGEGCGAIVLKRLCDARRDGDRILAVVKGTAINQDGRSTGITAPNGRAQQKVIRQAIENAGITPSDVDYIEAHGTGTPLGDPIEVEAIGNVMKERTAGAGKVAVGSVKSNIGHLESAAGMPGLLKIVLALQHEMIPANLHFTTPSPYIPWDEIPVEVVADVKAWPRSGRPRIAGMSSFGFSGTNVHVILEEAPPLLREEKKPDRPCHILALSARSKEALAELIGTYGESFLEGSGESPADICHTAATGRVHFDWRAHALGETKEELRAALQTLLKEPARLLPVKGDDRVAFLFTGQGSQYKGMARMLYDGSPLFRETLDECDRLLRPHMTRPLLEVLYDEKGDQALIDQTEYAQVAIFAVEYALLCLWRSWGIEPSIVLGHSIGEYVAACAAGIFTLEDALTLVAARGRLMQSVTAPGLMASMGASEQEVMSLLEGHEQSVSIAAINGPGLSVISGDRQLVETLAGEFQEKGKSAKLLRVSHAFHSPHMEAILADFERIATSITYHAPRLPLVSNRTGKVATAEEITKPSYWREHIRGTVRFHESMKTLEELGYELFLETGGDSTLTSLAMQCLDRDDATYLTSLKRGKNDWKTILGSLGALYGRGVAVNWQGFDSPFSRHKVSLPTYPFQRKRYFMNPVREVRKPGMQDRLSADSCHPFIGQKIESPALEGTILYQSLFSGEKPSFLKEHVMFGATVSPGAAHISMMLSALAFQYNLRAGCLEEVNFLKPLVITEGEERKVQVILEPQGAQKDRVRIASLDPSFLVWDIHCTGILAHSPDSSLLQEKGEVNLAAMKSRCTNVIHLDELYEKLRKVGCSLGPQFRCIDELFYGTSEFLGLVRKKKEDGAPGVYEITPGLIDSILQVMLLSSAWAIRKVGEKGSLFIPMHVGKFIVFNSQLPEEFWCHCTYREEEETVTGTIDVFDGQGVRYLRIEELLARYTDRQIFLKGSKKSRLSLLYTLNWREQEEKPAPVDGAEKGAFIIFQDHRGVGEKLGILLQQAAREVVTVSAGDCYRQEGNGRFTVNPASKDDFTKLFRAQLSDSGMRRVDKILFLWPLDSSLAESDSASDLEEREHFLCGSFLFLLQALSQFNFQSPPLVQVVTSSVHAITGDEGPLSCAQSTLWGFGRAVSQELPHLWGGLIDSDDMVLSGELKFLAEEVLGRSGEDQVALRRGGRRFVARLERGTHLPFPDEPQEHFSADGTYLVTGGLGALGATLAGWLISKGCRHLLITGRDTTSLEKGRIIEKLKETGAAIHVVEGDISKIEDGQRIIDYARAHLPPLKGVFHLAGVLSDGLIEEQNWEGFRKVLAAKARGAWNLHLLTREMELDHFVMYSSASSLLGNPGQSNYAAANAFLDGLADHRRGQGLPALSINWSSWADAGMAAAAEPGKDHLAHYGVRHLKTDFALEMLDMILSFAGARLSVLDIDWETYQERLEQKNPSYLAALLPRESDKKEQKDRGLPEANILSALRSVPPMKRKETLLHHLQAWAARIMGCDDPRQVNVDKPLIEQGVDSLMIVEMRNRFNKGVNITLPMTVLFNYPTLRKVADYMITDLLTFPDEPASAGRESDETATADILQEIEALVKG